MTHATPTTIPQTTGYTREAVRIAYLSHELLRDGLTEARHEAICDEINALIDGKVQVMGARG